MNTDEDYPFKGYPWFAAFLFLFGVTSLLVNSECAIEAPSHGLSFLLLVTCVGMTTIIFVPFILPTIFLTGFLFFCSCPIRKDCDFIDTFIVIMATVCTGIMIGFCWNRCGDDGKTVENEDAKVVTV